MSRRRAFGTAGCMSAAETEDCIAIDPATGRPLWSFDAGARIRTTPALTDDAEIVGTMAGEVIAVDRSGRQRWRFATVGAAHDFSFKNNDTQIGRHPTDRGRRHGHRRWPRRKHLRHRPAQGHRTVARNPRWRFLDSRARSRPNPLLFGQRKRVRHSGGRPDHRQGAMADSDGQCDVRRNRQSRRRADQQWNQRYHRGLRRGDRRSAMALQPPRHASFRARSPRRAWFSPVPTTDRSWHSRPAARRRAAFDRSIFSFTDEPAQSCVLVQARGQERDPRRVPGRRLFQHGQSRLCPGTRLASYKDRVSDHRSGRFPAPGRCHCRSAQIISRSWRNAGDAWNRSAGLQLRCGWRA